MHHKLNSTPGWTCWPLGSRERGGLGADLLGNLRKALISSAGCGQHVCVPWAPGVESPAISAASWLCDSPTLAGPGCGLVACQASGRLSKTGRPHLEICSLSRCTGRTERGPLDYYRWPLLVTNRHVRAIFSMHGFYMKTRIVFPAWLYLYYWSNVWDNKDFFVFVFERSLLLINAALI